MHSFSCESGFVLGFGEEFTVESADASGFGLPWFDGIVLWVM